MARRGLGNRDRLPRAGKNVTMIPAPRVPLAVRSTPTTRLTSSDTAAIRAVLRDVRPDLANARLEWLGAGLSSIAILAMGAERTVLRFPADAVAAASVEREARLLPLVARHVHVAVPQLTPLPGNPFGPGSFGVYPMLAGTQLTPGQWFRRGLTSDPRIVTTIASVLDGLHAISVPQARQLGVPSLHVWDDGAAIGDDIEREVITALSPADAHAFRRAWAAGFAAAGRTSSRDVFLHGDFSLDHLLIDQRSIVSLIDFGDVVIGDELYDLRYLWDEGGASMARAVQAQRGRPLNDDQEDALRFLTLLEAAGDVLAVGDDDRQREPALRRLLRLVRCSATYRRAGVARIDEPHSTTPIRAEGATTVPGKPTTPTKAIIRKGVKSKAPPRITSSKPNARSSAGPCTLTLDIGGTGLKASVLDRNGAMLHDRVRVPTAYPCSPTGLVAALHELVSPLPVFDRVAVGFPGVVRHGVVRTAPHLITSKGPGTPVDPAMRQAWTGFDLGAALTATLGKATRVINDADLQGLDVAAGTGVEVIVTLGTGFGTAVVRDGVLSTHLEIAQHTFRHNETYDDQLGDMTRKKIGNKRWNRRVRRALDSLDTLIGYDHIFLGGGNTRHLNGDLGPKATIIDPNAGILGGLRLWTQPASLFTTTPPATTPS